MWFRLLLLSFSIGGWLVVVRMLGHRSLEPVVFGRYSIVYVILLIAATAVACALTVAHLQPYYALAFSVRRQIALSLASTCVFGFAATELAFRIFDLLGASFYEEVTRCMKDLEPDAELAYRHRSNFKTRYAGVDISFNEIGLRERPLSDDGEGKRILLLGDSVTFGWAVPDESTYGRQMERELRAAFGISARTVNSGVCGYNTIQEYRSLNRWGDRVRPDLVSLLFVDNDVQAVEPIRPDRTVALWSDGPSSTAERLLRSSWTYRVAAHLIPFLLSRPLAAVERGRDWRASMNALADIARYCGARDIPLVVFLYRMQPDPSTNAMKEDISALAASERFVFADVLPWFAGRNVRQYVNSPVDAHPNAAGHAVLAREMASVIGSSLWRNGEKRVRTAGGANARSH